MLGFPHYKGRGHTSELVELGCDALIRCHKLSLGEGMATHTGILAR